MTLIGYWPLNESSGATEPKDHSGNENHGTINDGNDSTLPGANGPLGQNAYEFDGKNDYVNIGEPSAYSTSSLGNSVSVSGWFYPESNQGDVFGHASDSNNDNVRIFWDSSNNSWASYVDADNSNVVTWNDSPSLDSWNHVVLVYDGSNQIQFLNGKVTYNSSNSGTLSSASGSLWTVGSRGGDSSFLQGKISEVRIYDRPLTMSEVQYLYNVGQRGQHVTSKKTS